MWFHSSVGRASYRYRGGHGFESCGSPYIFLGFFLPIASIGKFTAMIILHFHLQPQYNMSFIQFSFSAIKRIDLIPCYLSGWSLLLLRSFLFYGTTQTPHYVGFCFCPLTTLVVTCNCHTSCLHKCSSFMAKNASKAYTKNNTSRKQTRQPGFTDGNNNGL